VKLSKIAKKKRKKDSESVFRLTSELCGSCKNKRDIRLPK